MVASDRHPGFSLPVANHLLTQALSVSHQSLIALRTVDVIYVFVRAHLSYSRFLLIILSRLVVAIPAVAGVRVENVRCEYLQYPLGVDSVRPRLSWTLAAESRGARQTAYQIVVASSEVGLQVDEGDLWGSGRVESDQSLNIVYAGRDLTSAQRCWWKVRVWDEAGTASDWSKPAFWEMGLLKPGDWQPARWIRAPDALNPSVEPVPAPLLRTAFMIDKPVARARLYGTGLGFHELYLNGEKVGDQVLSPVFTQYEKRVCYLVHDVTAHIREGRNALGAMLGNGWYNQHAREVWQIHRAAWRDRPKLLCKLVIEFADGSHQVIASGPDWRVTQGAIRYDGIRNGETYDAREEKSGWATADFDDTEWPRAVPAEPPAGELAWEGMPPVRVTQTLKPVTIKDIGAGRQIVDFGQNVTGWARLRVTGPAGTEIKLTYGERLREDGSVSHQYLDKHVKSGGFQTDRYILSGRENENWEPRFTYHGFRFVEISGYPGKLSAEDIAARVLRTDFSQAGDFRCSDKTVNRIVECASWSYRGNFQGRPTDCPHREKNGWAGDAVMAAEQAMYQWHNVPAYEQWMRSFRDVQRPHGQMPLIIPTGDWGYDYRGEVQPPRDAAFLVIPWYLYLYHGDRRVLEDNFPGMKAWVDYCGTRARDHIVDEGIGDHSPAGEPTETALTSTAFYFQGADLLARIAGVIGRDEEAKRYTALAQEIKAAYQKRFRRDGGTYGEGTQTAQACTLGLGLCSPQEQDDVVARLVDDVEARGRHLATGNLGTKYLFRALSRNGHADLAYEAAMQRSSPGYGYWIDQGATTLWEWWTDDSPSLNHGRWADIVAWFHQELAGLRADPAYPGFKHFIVQPHLLGDLTWVSAWHDSVHGRIETAWRRDGERLTMTVLAPPNTTATIHVPARSKEVVTLDGQPPEKVEGVKFLRFVEGRAVYEIGSGRYEFISKP